VLRATPPNAAARFSLAAADNGKSRRRASLIRNCLISRGEEVMKGELVKIEELNID
jgi:hypothetical protein